jgi:3-oxoacyl-[acyl-carrier protein] reductase
MKQRSGLVINFGSISGRRAAPQMAIYGAVKAAVRHLTTSLAAEYAARGIRFLCIDPGPIQTDLLDPLMFAMLEKKVPLGRLGQPEEVAALVRYLFTDEARFMTGSSLTIDGGTAL